MRSVAVGTPVAGPMAPTEIGPFRTQPANTTRFRQGLVTHASLGEIFFPLYSRPWSGDSSTNTAFPDVRPSAVAPNGRAPQFVVAINAYSPIAHRNPLRDRVPPPAIPARSQTGQRGGGPLRQRPRPYAMPYVTRWPQIAPAWPSWAESPNARP